MNRAWLLLAAGCSTASTEQAKDTRTEGATVAADSGDDATDSTPNEDTQGVDAETGSPPPEPAGCVGPNPVSLSDESCVAQAACQWTGSQYYGGLGYSMDLGGDVDGDGTVDMVVGAYLEDEMDGDSIVTLDAGQVHLWLGSDRAHRMEASGTLRGSTIGSNLGYDVAIVPDINGDGLDEILAGGRGTSTEADSALGEVQLVLGKADGFDSLVADRTWFGEHAYDRIGSTVKGLGDTNGDGLGELAFTTNNRKMSSSGYESPGPGAVLVFNGRADPETLPPVSSPDARFEGIGASDSAGHAIATGDLNGDGHPDLAIGAPYGHSNYGRIAIFAGSSAGFSGTKTLDDATVDIRGTQYSSALGYSLAIADLDGDGFAELVAGSPLGSERFSKGGSVRIFNGDEDFFIKTPEANTVLTGEFDDHQFGIDVVAGPDINGDGHPDLLVGAIYAWRGLVTKGGRVYGFHGPRADWGEEVDAESAAIQLFGAATKDYVGRATDAADLNGDGKADIVTSTAFVNRGSDYDAGGVYLFWGE